MGKGRVISKCGRGSRAESEWITFPGWDIMEVQRESRCKGGAGTG